MFLQKTYYICTTFNCYKQNKMVRKYDVFISYRRDDGAQYARILQLELEKRGYKVFLDYEELTDGVFGDNIKEAIKEATFFLMVLTPKYLERSMESDSWVREEIELAIKNNKHFIRRSRPPFQWYPYGDTIDNRKSCEHTPAFSH